MINTFIKRAIFSPWRKQFNLNNAFIYLSQANLSSKDVICITIGSCVFT